jgi:drug/metabolite transporter (DMT)-like permease
MFMETAGPRSPAVAALVVGLALVWGTSWVMFPIILREVSIWSFRAVSLLSAGLLLLAVARLRGLSLEVPAKQRVPLAMAAMVYLVTWNLATTYASTLIPSGQAAVLGFTMPVWAGLLSWALLGERPSARTVFGALLAGAGVACLAINASGRPLGFLLGLLGAIGWAAGTMILKRAALTVPLIVSTGWQLVVSGVPIAAVALASGGGHSGVPSWTALCAIAYITVVPMAFGGMVWFFLADVLTPTLSGLATVMVPMVAMLTGALVNGEPLGPLQFMAMGCCGASLVVSLSRRPEPAA